ncbi:MAG: iron complex outermembrane receptor protein [Halioglobus sp.]|jgi:iron complex outermembrane receptor protein
MITKKKLLASAVMAMTGTFALQTAAESILEEIVVTAQKREQGLQDVGIAVTAFSGAQLRAFNVTESFDVAAYTPGVHISGNLAGQNVQFSIRGVTQNDFNDIIESPNAVYLDEGYIAIAQAQTFAMLDIQRVEILKGPQGTLFGRNATGGVVNYFSTAPSFENFEGYVNADYTLFDTPNDASGYTVEGAFGGPISDTVAFRFAGRYNEQDPYLENRYPEGAPDFDVFGNPGFNIGSPGQGAGADLGDDETVAARLTFAFRPSDDLEITLSGNYADTEVSTGPYQSKPTIAIGEAVPSADFPFFGDLRTEVYNVIDIPANETRISILTENGVDNGADGGGDGLTDNPFGPGNCAAIGLCERQGAGTDFFGYSDPDGDDFTFSSDFAFADQGSTETTGLNARVEYDINENLSFVSVTDYKDYEKLLFIDVDAGPVNQLANYGAVDATSFTQELRLSGSSDRSQWVFGLYYLNIDTDSFNGLKAPAQSIFGTIALPADIATVATLETDSYSAFGQYEYELSEKVSVIGGLRIMREEKDFEVGIGIAPSFGNGVITRDVSAFLPNVSGANDPFFFNDDTSDDLWAGKLQLDYRHSDDLLLYAGINRGVKAGSFNAPLLGAYLGSGANAGLPFDEEVLTSYEVGFKATLQDGKTRINGSAYYYDYEDYQAFLFVGVGGVSLNKDAETVGAEIEIMTSPMDGLDLILSASYVDAEIKDLPLRSGSPLETVDVVPTYTPEFQAFAMARYGWDMLGGTMVVQGDVSYSDEFYYNLRNFDADKFDSYTMVNGLVSWESASEAPWSVSLALRNATDERAGVQGFDLATLCGCNEVSYRAPRHMVLGLRKEF